LLLLDFKGTGCLPVLGRKQCQVEVLVVVGELPENILQIEEGVWPSPQTLDTRLSLSP